MEYSEVKNNYVPELVSIVMPTYNSEEYVADSIESIINQTYESWELNVVDDASTDSTVDILRRYEQLDSRIKISINKVNSGAAVTRNVSLRLSKGQYIAFLDSDDLWEPNKLSLQLDYMKNNDINFSFTSFRIISGDSGVAGMVVDSRPGIIVDYNDMLAKRATLGCSTVVLNQESIGKVQMPLIRTGQDYALWLQILKMGHKAHCLNQVLTKYRIVPGSISRNKLKKARRQWEIYRKLEKLNPVISAWYFMNYAWRAVFRS